MQPAELQIAVGNISSSGIVTWLGGYVFPYTHNGAGGVELVHDLTHDHNQFILGIVRQDFPPSPPLKHYSLYIYASKDGLKWQLRSILGLKTVSKSMHNSGSLGLAAKSNGHMLVAQFVAEMLKAFHYDGNLWSDISSTFSSAYPAKNTYIAVVNTRHP